MKLDGMINLIRELITDFNSYMRYLCHIDWCNVFEITNIKSYVKHVTSVDVNKTRRIKLLFFLCPRNRFDTGLNSMKKKKKKKKKKEREKKRMLFGGKPK